MPIRSQKRLQLLSSILVNSFQFDLLQEATMADQMADRKVDSLDLAAACPAAVASWVDRLRSEDLVADHRGVDLLVAVSADLLVDRGRDRNS